MDPQNPKNQFPDPPVIPAQPLQSTPAPQPQIAPLVTPVPSAPPPGMPAQPAYATPITPPATKTSHIVLIVIACIIGSLAIFGGLIFGIISVVNETTAGAVKASNSYVADLQAGNYSGAASLESSKFKQVASQARVQAAWKSYGIAGAHYSVVGKAINKTAGNDADAAVVYKFTGVGEPFYVKFGLEDNNGQWQILSFDGTNSNPGSVVD